MTKSLAKSKADEMKAARKKAGAKGVVPYKHIPIGAVNPSDEGIVDGGSDMVKSGFSTDPTDRSHDMGKKDDDKSKVIKATAPAAIQEQNMATPTTGAPDAPTDNAGTLVPSPNAGQVGTDYERPAGTTMDQIVNNTANPPGSSGLTDNTDITNPSTTVPTPDGAGTDSAEQGGVDTNEQPLNPEGTEQPAASDAEDQRRQADYGVSGSADPATVAALAAVAGLSDDDKAAVARMKERQKAVDAEARAAKLKAREDAEAKRKAEKAAAAEQRALERQARAAEREQIAEAARAAGRTYVGSMTALGAAVKAGKYVKGLTGQLRSTDELAVALDAVPPKNVIALAMNVLALEANPYATLNQGQQSMNLRNRLRGAIKAGKVKIEDVIRVRDENGYATAEKEAAAKRELAAAKKAERDAAAAARAKAADDAREAAKKAVVEKAAAADKAKAGVPVTGSAESGAQPTA